MSSNNFCLLAKYVLAGQRKFTHKEKNFENAIASDLAASGWRRSENDEGYDRARALYPADVFDWLKTAYPKEFAQLQKLSSWEVMLLDRLQEVARQHGALALLRDPIGIAGVGRFKMSESAPEVLMSLYSVTAVLAPGSGRFFT